jgi:hypothetical protein
MGRTRQEAARLGGGALRGEAHPKAKLTSAQVAEIKARVAAGEKQITMVREYGSSKATISFIINGKTRATG